MIYVEWVYFMSNKLNYFMLFSYQIYIITFRYATSVRLIANS